MTWLDRISTADRAALVDAGRIGNSRFDGPTPAKPKCPRCQDNGIVLTGNGWDVCDCDAGCGFSETLERGIEDIKAGRVHKWTDIRRDK